MADTPSTEQWAIVEIFGHQRIAGRLTEQTIGGCSFVRVDVPALPQADGEGELPASRISRSTDHVSRGSSRCRRMGSARCARGTGPDQLVRLDD
jgi:hypothetical protein